MMPFTCRLIFIILLLLPGLGFAQAANGPLTDLQENINQAVATVRPSVVSITAKKKAPKAQAGPWYDSIGSGFVIDKRGYILTNNHVVVDAVDVEVKFWRTPPNIFKAKIVQTDPEHDFALLKVEGSGFYTPAPLADSDRIELGDWVMSVGSPFGFEHSIALGMVSSKNRVLHIGNREYKAMIQTDAVINEGNSGGPLIDVFGRVVGICTAIYAPDGTYTGLGFAIPINRAKHFFTRTTGAVTAALPLPALKPLSVIPIDLNLGPPNDFNHIKFRDCTRCHQILHKKVIFAGAKRPHSMVGACNKCHILESRPSTGAPVTVAGQRPYKPIANDQYDFWTFFKTNMLKAVPLLLVSSVIFSMLGLGGGFFYVPILLYAGIDFHTAGTTSLLMLTLGSASALHVFHRSGMVDGKLVAALAAPAVVGAFAGGLSSTYFDISFLYMLFSMTLFVAAYFMLQDSRKPMKRNVHFEKSPLVMRRLFHDADYTIDLLVAGPLVLLVSYLGGLLGIAGGWFIVPMLVLFFAVPMRVAVASSSLLVPVNGIAAFTGHGIAGHIDWHLALTLSALAVIGAQIGARISIRTDTGLLRVIFACILSLVGLWMVSKIFFMS